MDSKSNYGEKGYLNLLQKIINEGEERDDRTGVGTLSLFGESLLFDLSRFPLLTTKKMFWRAIVEELLWFIRGSTNEKDLSTKGIRIWEGNAQGNGDLGPIYGFQWRHFGATYIDCNTNYNGQGVDQLQWCINEIKTNPTSRRIVMSAWNPTQLNEMALPPCHMFCQFYVCRSNDTQGTLSCNMYQRSCDMGLGVPFNIASYALLTYLIAHICNLTPGKLTIMMGDVHIYKNHVDVVKEQLTRTPYEFPTLVINSNSDKKIDSFSFDDLTLENYRSYSNIKMMMAV